MNKQFGIGLCLGFALGGLIGPLATRAWHAMDTPRPVIQKSAQPEVFSRALENKEKHQKKLRDIGKLYDLGVKISPYIPVEERLAIATVIVSDAQLIQRFETAIKSGVTVDIVERGSENQSVHVHSSGRICIHANAPLAEIRAAFGLPAEIPTSEHVPRDRFGWPGFVQHFTPSSPAGFLLEIPTQRKASAQNKCHE